MNRQEIKWKDQPKAMLKWFSVEDKLLKQFDNGPMYCPLTGVRRLSKSHARSIVLQIIKRTKFWSEGMTVNERHDIVKFARGG